MKVTPVSSSVTTPADTAASMADPEVSGVVVPATTTVDARYHVTVTPGATCPVRAWEVQELLPELKLGWLPKQTTR